MTQITLPVKRFHKKAILPTQGTKKSAGYDLYLPEDITLYVGSDPIIVPLGIGVAIPDGYVGKIWSRSGHFVKAFLNASNAGVIDSDYRGEIKIGLQLLKKRSWIDVVLRRKCSYVIPYGRAIAQLVLIKVENTLDAEWVEEFDDMTDRNDRGFGSTDKKGDNNATRNS